MTRGYLDDNVFHAVRECEGCVDPSYELSITMALKWGAGLCECVPAPNRSESGETPNESTE